MTDPNHKKLPWSVADRNMEIMIKSGDGSVIGVLEVFGRKSRKKALSDAYFIVKAVNSHEGMVDALGATYALLMPIGNHSKNPLLWEVIKKVRVALETTSEIPLPRDKGERDDSKK